MWGNVSLLQASLTFDPLCEGLTLDWLILEGAFPPQGFPEEAPRESMKQPQCVNVAAGGIWDQDPGSSAPGSLESIRSPVRQDIYNDMEGGS